MPRFVATVALGAVLAESYGRVNKENAAAFAGRCRSLLQALELSDKQFVQILGQATKAIKESQQ